MYGHILFYNIYRTRANKGRRHYLKIMVWGLKLPGKKDVKNGL